MSITINIRRSQKYPSQPWDRTLRVPNDGFRYIRVPHDWEESLKWKFDGEPRQFGQDFEQVIEVPSTRPLRGETKTKPSDFVYMRESWQRRQLELLIWAARGKAPMGEVIKWVVVIEKDKLKEVPKGTKNAYPMYQPNSILGVYQRLFQDHAFLSDAHAWNTFAADADPRSGLFKDYVLSFNMKNPLPWAQKSITMTGNIHRLIENTIGMEAGEIARMHKVEALDGTKDAPPLDYLLNEKMHCILACTEQGLNLYPNGTWTVAPFWHLEPWGAGTPIFSLAKKDWNLIEKVYAEPIAPGTRYSPYNPPRL
jgi:hypothetical protein